MGTKKKDRNMRSAEDRREKMNTAGKNSAKTRPGTGTSDLSKTGSSKKKT